MYRQGDRQRDRQRDRLKRGQMDRSETNRGFKQIDRETDLPVPFVESKSNRCGTVGDHKAQDLSRDAWHANTQDPAGRLVEVWYPGRLG